MFVSKLMIDIKEKEWKDIRYPWLSIYYIH